MDACNSQLVLKKQILTIISAFDPDVIFLQEKVIVFRIYATLQFL